MSEIDPGNNFEKEPQNDEFASRQEIINNPFLRREAGEGWAAGGVNEHLLSRIADREEVIEAMRENGVHPPQTVAKEGEIPEYAQIVFKAYKDIAQDVERIKQELGLGYPPISEDSLSEFERKFLDETED